MFTTLRSKILAGFAAVIAINVVFGLWSIFQFSRVGNTATDVIATNYDLISNTIQLGSIIDMQYSLLQEMLGKGKPEQTTIQFDQKTSEFKLLLLRVASNRIAAGKRPVIDTISAGYERFLASASRYQKLIETARLDSASALLGNRVEADVNDLKQNCFTILNQNRDEIADVRATLSGELHQALLFVGAATIVALILGAVGGGVYSRWALQPVARLTQAAKNLAGGKLSERVLITTADELGDLSYEFNRMIERLRHYEAMNIEQLLLEKRKVETIVRSIATPIIVVDAEMHLLLINSAALALFRLPLQGVVYDGESVEQFIRDDNVLQSLRSALNHNHDSQVREPYIYMLHEEGVERFYSVSALPLETSSSVSGAVAVFSDITHFKELDRLKSDFLAKVSHEFRTPVSSIMMSLDILREGIVGTINDEQLDLLNSSKDDCKRLSKLITELLELARIESKETHRVPQLIDFARFIESLVKPHLMPAREKGIALNLEVANDIPQLWCDPEELRWVFNNLFSNALRHTHEGDSITLRAKLERDNLEVSIEDSGDGIPADSVGKIFEKFHQVGLTSVSTPGSVGLGLAIAREVVERYGGTIGVTSELHKGSCFTVLIPMASLTLTTEQVNDQS